MATGPLARPCLDTMNTCRQWTCGDNSFGKINVRAFELRLVRICPSKLQGLYIDGRQGFSEEKKLDEAWRVAGEFGVISSKPAGGVTTASQCKLPGYRITVRIQHRNNRAE